GRVGPKSALAAVQALAQLLAGLEEGDDLARDLDLVAGARVAAGARIAGFDRKGAEAAQLDPVAPCQRGRNFLEYRRHDPLDVAMIKVRVQFSDPKDEFGLGHRHSPGARQPRRPSSGAGCQSGAPPSRISVSTSTIF